MIDDIDRALINDLQGGFPLSERPFADVGGEHGLSEDEVIARLQSLLDQKILSRFGPMYDAERIGGGLALAALEVPDARFDEVTEIVNSFDQVAHNYERAHKLNMWFVLATESPEGIAEAIEQIEAATGLHVFNMPKEQEYFLELKLCA